MTNTHQFSTPEVADQDRYLGNAHVVHKFMADFALEVISAYDKYLAGIEGGHIVQPKIDTLINKWADGLMGRDESYQIAPWQGKKFRRTVLALIPSFRPDDDCGVAFFKFYAVQCINASLALSQGMDDEEAGEKLREILLDGEKTLLGLNYP